MGLLQSSMQNIQVSLPNVQVNSFWDETLLGPRRMLYFTETELYRSTFKYFKQSSIKDSMVNSALPWLKPRTCPSVQWGPRSIASIPKGLLSVFA